MRYPEENEVIADNRDDAELECDTDDWRAECVLQTPEEIAEFEAFLDDNPELSAEND